MCAGKAAQHFAMTIEREQEMMMNLADMVIEVYTAESAILRTEKLAAKNVKAYIIQETDPDTAINKLIDGTLKAYVSDNEHQSHDHAGCNCTCGGGGHSHN